MVPSSLAGSAAGSPVKAHPPSLSIASSTFAQLTRSLRCGRTLCPGRGLHAADHTQVSRIGLEMQHPVALRPPHPHYEGRETPFLPEAIPRPLPRKPLPYWGATARKAGADQYATWWPSNSLRKLIGDIVALGVIPTQCDVLKSVLQAPEFDPKALDERSASSGVSPPLRYPWCNKDKALVQPPEGKRTGHLCSHVMISWVNHRSWTASKKDRAG